MMLQNMLDDAVTVMCHGIHTQQLYWLKLDKQEVYNCTPIAFDFNFHSALQM